MQVQAFRCIAWGAIKCTPELYHRQVLQQKKIWDNWKNNSSKIQNIGIWRCMWSSQRSRSQIMNRIIKIVHSPRSSEVWLTKSPILPTMVSRKMVDALRGPWRNLDEPHYNQRPRMDSCQFSTQRNPLRMRTANVVSFANQMIEPLNRTNVNARYPNTEVSKIVLVGNQANGW